MFVVGLRHRKAARLCWFLSAMLLTCLSQNLDRKTNSLMLRDKAKNRQRATPYASAAHYWPLNQIIRTTGKTKEIVKDVFGVTNAKVSEGVTTQYDDQLGRVVSLNAKDDSLVMNPLKSRCISDPTTCEMGITVEFWLKFRKGECILSTGGYTKRYKGPGFILRNIPKKRRLALQLSTTSKLWTLEFNVRRSAWVHLLFTWKQSMGLVLYENGNFLTKATAFQSVRYPDIINEYRTLAVGAQENLIKIRSGGVFEIGHLVIWTRSLSVEEIQNQVFLSMVKRSKRSIICCRRKRDDPCISDGCYYKPRCNTIHEKYPCICPRVKEIKGCENESPVKPCRDVADNCLTIARQPNYCTYYSKRMRASCSQSCQFCVTGTPSIVAWSPNESDHNSKTIIVAIAVGVACIVMLLVIIAIVMARMNSKMQGEFIPNPLQDGTISPDNNTHEMIAAAVDPAPRITDVPFKSPKAKKTTKVELKQSDFMTSEI